MPITNPSEQHSLGARYVFIWLAGVSFVSTAILIWVGVALHPYLAYGTFKLVVAASSAYVAYTFWHVAPRLVLMGLLTAGFGILILFPEIPRPHWLPLDWVGALIFAICGTLSLYAFIISPAVFAGSAGEVETLTHQGVVRRTVPGILAIVAAIWFYNSLIPNPVESLCLLKWGRPAKARIIYAYEDFQEQDAGPGYMFCVITYEFNTADGKEVRSTTRQIRGGLPEEFQDEATRPLLDIDYYPAYPQWNRIKGTEPTNSMFGWFWRSLIGLSLLCLFLAPGIGLLSAGWREIRDAKRAVRDPRRKTVAELENAEEEALRDSLICR